MHASRICFTKFLGTPKVYRVEKLVLGGDLTGKSITPIVDQGDGSFSAEFLGLKMNLRTEDEVKALEKKMRDSGSYPVKVGKSEVEELLNNKKVRDGWFERVAIETLREWISLADERLRGTGVEIYVTGGNDDEYYIDKVLGESNTMKNVDNRVLEIGDGYSMVGSSHSNVTPWQCARDISEEKLSEVLETLVSKVSGVKRCILNVHCPPFESGLDMCPKLDDSTFPPKLVTRNGNVVYYGAGSTAVRNVIERYQPLVGLHGHIHESRNMTKIGKTVCINPGSEYTEGILKGAIVELDGERVKRTQFTSG